MNASEIIQESKKNSRKPGILPICTQIISETPIIIWPITPSSDYCLGCVKLLTNIRVPGRICSNPFKYCSEQCEEISFTRVCFCLSLFRKPGIMQKLWSIRKQKFNGATIVYIYADIISSYMSNVMKGMDERSAFLKSVLPICKLFQSVQNKDLNFSVNQVLDLISPIFNDSQQIFKMKYSDYYSTYSFPFVKLLLKTDFCRMVCLICQQLSFELVPGIYGLVSEICKVKHSCQPNCYVKFLNRKLYLYAYQTIEENEQLTISYVNNNLNYSMRSQQLLSIFGESCRCIKCLQQK